MQRFFRAHGFDGYVLKCDIKNYFGSTSHAVAEAAIRKRVRDKWAADEAVRIINSFNQGDDPDVGMGLGSQITQLVELAVLDDLDHYIKERLHIKQYVRYMDDFILVHENKQYLVYSKMMIARKLAELGLQLHAKKTQIFPISQPIHFLGFSYRLTSTGGIVAKVLPKRVVHCRRHFKHLVRLSQAGAKPRSEVDDCFMAWVAHASKGNCYHLIAEMTKFYNNLWEV